METKRLRDSSQHQQDEPGGGRRRRARVRNRLLVCVLVGTLAVVGAGTPMLVAASSDLTESQRLVERAETGKRAVSLAHALADERDAQMRRLAAKGAAREAEPPAGNPGDGLPGQGQSGQQRPGQGAEEQVEVAPLEKQVDSRVRELRAELPAEVGKLVDSLPGQRRQARTADGGPDSVLALHRAYADVIQALGGLTEDTARDLPARATEGTGSADPYALPYLGRRVEQAAATRGLLLAALTAGGPQPALTSAAQQARVREQAADADFEDVAHEDTRDRLTTTVTGSEVTTAEQYLNRLTANNRLSPAAQRFRLTRVDTALTARVDQMRGVHSTLAVEEVARLEKLRDDDVTSLQLGFVWVGAALLLAVGAGVYSARSMTRPLAVLRRGSARVAADPAEEPPIRFTGRNDEFAEVVRHLNALRETAVQLGERAETAEADAVRQAAGRKKLAASREELRARAAELEQRLEELDGAVHGAFVQLALRNLSLTERQLAQLETLEEREHEPSRLSTLFTLDHLATRMRRHGENLLLLAGAEHATHQHPEPVPLLDVLRAAISEIERYERVELATLPPHTQVAGFAADDISHLVAELLDNATAFSPPEAEVQLSGWMLENGELMLSVADMGIGMTAERLAAVNERLSEPDKQDPPSADGGDALGVGLYVVARLAARHGMRVQLRMQEQGGVTAVVVVPRALLPDRPVPGKVAPAGGAAGAVQALPGTEAEANSHALPARRRPPTAVRETPAPAAGSEPGERTGPEAADREGDGAEDAPSAEAAPAQASRTEPRTAPVEAPGPDAPTEPDAPAAQAPSENPPAASGSLPDEAAGTGPEEAAGTGLTGSEEAADEPAAEGPLPRTSKGLPKRTPHISPVPPPTAAVPAPRAGDARADELRRRLGGFRQGTQQGERDAAAQLAAEHNSEPASDNPAGPHPDNSPTPDRPGTKPTVPTDSTDTGTDTTGTAGTTDTRTTGSGTDDTDAAGDDTTETTDAAGQTHGSGDTTRGHTHEPGADQMSETAEEARQ